MNQTAALLLAGLVVIGVALVMAGDWLERQSEKWTRERPSVRYDISARRGSEIAEFMFRPEPEATRIEQDLAADGWAVKRRLSGDCRVTGG